MRRLVVIYSLLMIVLSIVGCINIRPKSHYNNRDSTTVLNDTTTISFYDSCVVTDQLPLKIEVPNDLDSMELMKKEIENLEKCVFHNQSSLTIYDSVFINSEFIGKGIESTIKCYKILPNIGDVKVVLFIYLRECHNDNYPAIELQTFDSNNIFIDRLLVSTAIFEEGGLFRYSEIDLNYKIKVKDVIVRYDLENTGEEEYKTEIISVYKIDKNGFFIKQ